ncbi:MAG TPA: FecR domain-containing protein [Rhizomicrobium sp.]
MSAPNAKTINMEAAGWIERQDQVGWSEADQALFGVWLNQSTAHFIAYHRMQDTWQRSEKLVVLRTRTAPLPQESRSRVPLAFKALAGVLAAGILGAGVIFLARPGERTYATAIGERQTLKLSDGSKIELNTDTVVRVAQNDRDVVLERGEAFFQVQHDSKQPFAVTVGNRRVTDLGTKFDIRKDLDRVEVALVEGRARVDVLDAASARPTVLTPGDVMIAARQSVSLAKRPAASVADALGWRRDVIVFDHTSLAAAAEEINRYNRRKIVVADSDAAKLKIGGTFPVNGTMQLAEVARDLFKLRVDDRGDEIVISR